MKIDDAELKRLLQEGMDYEADCIMAEVESDPNMQDVVAPEVIFDNLLKQIREREDEKEKERETLSQEQQELIRLGKIYQKKRGRRKYIVLIAAVVCALGVGTISFGDRNKVLTAMKRILFNKEQTVLNTGDEDTSFAKDIADEEDAYEQIYNKFGFYPVRMLYLPEGIKFQEAIIEKDKQLARIYYTDEESKSISYRMITNYREGSVGTDIEDTFIKEYKKEVDGVEIIISQYKVEQNHTLRWSISFTYKKAQYTLLVMGTEEGEVNKIIENLYFS